MRSPPSSADRVPAREYRVERFRISADSDFALVDSTTPVEICTPDVSPLSGRNERVEEYRLEQLAKWPFVLSCEEAQARLEKRSATIALPSIAPETEPRSYKRRVGSRARMKAHVGSKEDTPGD